MTHLRLDMYINGHEYMIMEDSATERGFLNCVRNAHIAFQAIDDEIKTTGRARLSPEMLTDDDMLDILWDQTGREIKVTDEVDYMICLWEGNEHVKSCVTLSELGE